MVRLPLSPTFPIPHFLPDTPGPGLASSPLPGRYPRTAQKPRETPKQPKNLGRKPRRGLRMLEGSPRGSGRASHVDPHGKIPRGRRGSPENSGRRKTGGSKHGGPPEPPPAPAPRHNFPPGSHRCRVWGRLRHAPPFIPGLGPPRDPEGEAPQRALPSGLLFLPVSGRIISSLSRCSRPHPHPDKEPEPPRSTPTSRLLFLTKPQTNNPIIPINIPRNGGFQAVPAPLGCRDEAGAVPAGRFRIPRLLQAGFGARGGTRGPPRWEQLAADPAGRAGGGAGGGGGGGRGLTAPNGGESGPPGGGGGERGLAPPKTDLGWQPRGQSHRRLLRPLVPQFLPPEPPEMRILGGTPAPSPSHPSGTRNRREKGN